MLGHQEVWDWTGRADPGPVTLLVEDLRPSMTASWTPMVAACKAGHQGVTLSCGLLIMVKQTTRLPRAL